MTLNFYFYWKIALQILQISVLSSLHENNSNLVPILVRNVTNFRVIGTMQRFFLSHCSIAK